MNDVIARLGLTPGEIKQVAFAAAALVEQRRVPELVRSAGEEDSGVQRMPPTLDELRVRLEQELAREPELLGDEESWYSYHSWRASVLSIRVEIAELEGADPGEVRRLKRELEEARYVGD